MEILNSESLQTRLNNSPYVTCEKRSLYPQLQQYIKSPNDGRICCLYGLRRTGKTVMMEQMMREIGQPDKTLLIIWNVCFQLRYPVPDPYAMDASFYLSENAGYIFQNHAR